MADKNSDDTQTASKLATDITIAWLQNPNVHPGVADVSNLLTTVLAAFDRNSTDATTAPVQPNSEAATAPQKAQPKPARNKSTGKDLPPKPSLPPTPRNGAENGTSSTDKAANIAETATVPRTRLKTKTPGLALLKGLSAPATAALPEASSSEPVSAPVLASPKRKATEAPASTATRAKKTEAKIAPIATAAPKRGKATVSANASAAPSTKTAAPVTEAPKRARRVLGLKFEANATENTEPSAAPTTEAPPAKSKAAPKPRRMAREAKPSTEPASKN